MPRSQVKGSYSDADPPFQHCEGRCRRIPGVRLLTNLVELVSVCHQPLSISHTHTHSFHSLVKWIVLIYIQLPDTGKVFLSDGDSPGFLCCMKLGRFWIIRTPQPRDLH